MTDNESPKFKIRFDDEVPLDVKVTEPPIQAKVENLHLKKLNRRINLFAVLIPSLLAMIFVFGYFDIRKRSAPINISDSPDVQTLSKELDSKFSALSVRQAKIEALLTSKLSEMEKTAARLEQKLGQAQQGLSGAKSSTTGKEEIAAIMAEVEKVIAPVRTDIKKLSSEVKKISSDARSLQDKFDKDFGKQASAISTLEKEAGTLKTDTAARVDKKTFDLTVRHQEKFYQQKLTDLEKSLAEKIDALRNQIKALDEKQKKTGAANATPALKPPLSAPPPVESIKPAIPQSGKIIEQEINR